MDLATAFQKYAHNENGQLILQFSGTEHLCKISIEDSEAVNIIFGRLGVDESIEFATSHTIAEVSFIKGFIPKKKLPVPITDRLFGVSANKTSKENLVVQKTFSSGEQIPSTKINKVINGYVDIVGPLGVVVLENVLKKLNYTRNTSMPADDYNLLVEKLVMDVPEDMQPEFLETII